jgi:hypothetical protein
MKEKKCTFFPTPKEIGKMPQNKNDTYFLKFFDLKVIKHSKGPLQIVRL